MGRSGREFHFNPGEKSGASPPDDDRGPRTPGVIRHVAAAAGRRPCYGHFGLDQTQKIAGCCSLSTIAISEEDEIYRHKNTFPRVRDSWHLRVLYRVPRTGTAAETGR